MDIPTSAEAPDRSLSLELEPEVSDLVKQENARLPSQVQVNAERIRSSVARLTSNSMNELEGLTSELQQLQEFLRSEAERVEREVESALAGIKIIVETISPWKSTRASPTPQRKESVNAVRVSNARRNQRFNRPASRRARGLGFRLGCAA
jgi:hypothetical protein